MMSDESDLQGQFNDGAGAEDSDSGQPKRAKTHRVIDYQDADDELRAQMDRLIDPIDRAPDNFDLIISWGSKPQQDLKKVAKQILEASAKLNDAVRTVDIKMAEVERGFVESGISGFMDAFKMAKSGTKAVAKGGASIIGRMFSAVKEAATGASRKRTPEQEEIHNLVTRIPEMFQATVTLLSSLDQAEKGLIEVMKMADNLGRARINVVKDLNVYLGAAPEILRRYDDVYIKEAKEAFEESNDPEDENLLEKMMDSKEDFGRQLTSLESVRTDSLLAAQQLKKMIQNMKKQRAMIKQYREIRETVWLAGLSEASIASSGLKSAELEVRAFDHNDQMMDLKREMIEKAHDILLQSAKRGVVNVQKFIDAQESMERMSRELDDARAEARRQLEEDRKELRAVSERILEQSEESRHARVLEASPEREEEKPAFDVLNPLQEPQNDTTPPKSKPRARRGGPARK